MNIPGPEKDNYIVAHGFELGSRLLMAALDKEKLLYTEKQPMNGVVKMALKNVIQ